MGTDAGDTALPSGLVTFLFTDIEGSTRRWEADPTTMRAALSAHDATLRTAIEAQGGHLFKHTGDGILASFASAQSAVLAGIEAQRTLELPVRMGLATGEVEVTNDDYFGPILNRAARVMSAGHGGQILVAESTMQLVEGVDFVDLGPRRLRDLSEPLRIFQVAADGLATDFPPLKTIDNFPGNLPAQATSFIGREAEVAELTALMADHRLVTLIGVGGVGKTRLSVQVAAELTPKFPGGVWFVELAPVTDPTDVPDTVATTLGITAQPGMTVTESICTTLSGREMLIVFDNCEHVLEAAAELVEAILTRTSTVRAIATSREGLRIRAEHSWPVPSLGVDAAGSSPAVALFAERAAAVQASFSLDDPDTAAAVVEICESLDGIALAIELAAARLSSMSAAEVRDRLGDRFRLLSGGRRGLERHQTLLHAVQWSYDLLDDDERAALDTCAVFLDGFDLDAITNVHQSDDEYEMLDLIDSLVRKSLITAQIENDVTRYELLETIRQFGERRLESAGSLAAVRERHASYFADGAVALWDTWDGPHQLRALNWLDANFANLRAAFRWGVDNDRLDTAVAITAHVTLMVWPLQRFEPVGWAEEILDRAIEADVRLLPKLYVAASLILYLGKPDFGVNLAQRAQALQNDDRYESFDRGWAEMMEALSNLFGGNIQRRVEISTDMAKGEAIERVLGLCGLIWALPAVGREAEAIEIVDDTLTAAREFGNPFWIGWSLGGAGRAYASSQPLKALEVLREGLDYSDTNRLGFWKANLSQDAARLEAEHGDPSRALELFDSAIDSFHSAGNIVFLAATLASLAVHFARTGEEETAATIYGASTRQASIGLVPHLSEVVEQLKADLGAERFATCFDTGAAQETAEAVQFAHEHLLLARMELAQTVST